MRIERVARGVLSSVPRGFAVFSGAFLALNAALATLDPRADAAVWLVDLRACPPTARAAALGAAGLVLAAWALRTVPGRILRTQAAAVAGSLAVVAAVNAATVLRLRADGAVATAALPLSAAVAAAFACVAVAAARGRPRPPQGVRPALVAALACAALFPVAQVAAFGRSDYRRGADAIVVFGAKAYPDGRASLTLEDRVRTACALWHEGRAPVLYLSGGPAAPGVHETDAMRRVALDSGVLDDAIVLDRDGLSTRATVEDAAAWLRGRGLRRVLAVSHAYHLPRVKLEFARAGVEAFTVPAHETRFVAKTPWFVAREVAAWWVAWASPRET